MRGGEERDRAAEAEADDAGAPVDLGQAAQMLERDDRVLHGAGQVELTDGLHRGLQTLLVVLELEPGLRAAVEVGRHRHVPQLGEPLGCAPDVGADAEDLHQDQQPRSLPGLGQRHKRVHRAAVGHRNRLVAGAGSHRAGAYSSRSAVGGECRHARHVTAEDHLADPIRLIVEVTVQESDCHSLDD